MVSLAWCIGASRRVEGVSVFETKWYSVPQQGYKRHWVGVCCSGREVRFVWKWKRSNLRSLPAAAEPGARGERPTAIPLLGSLLASLVGAPSALALAVTHGYSYS